MKKSKVATRNPRQFQAVDKAVSDSKPAHAIKDKAARMVQHLRDYHETGRLANLAEDERHHSTATFAAEHGLNERTLRAMKSFSRLYSANPSAGGNGFSELDELCALRRPNGLPLHSGYVPYLVSVRNTTNRRLMAEKAAAEGWSPARLHTEIRVMEGRPPGHGRTVKTPTTLLEGLHQVVREGNIWLTRSKKLMESLYAPGTAKLRSGDPAVIAAIKELARLVNRVQADSEAFAVKLPKISTARGTVNRSPRRSRTLNSHVGDS